MLSYFTVLFVVPIIVMIWKPTQFIIRHIPTILRFLRYFTTRACPQLLTEIWIWGRFVTWKLLLGVCPHHILFAIFWVIAPLYESQFKEAKSTSRFHSCSRNGMSLHRDTMVLTDVIHPAQGPFPMAYRGVLNPVALDRTQDFIIWYLDFIAPPMGFIAQSIFMYYCIAWGFNIFTRILLVRLVTKAEELWLLYWPPPTIDSVVFFQRLHQDTKFNGRSGIVKASYSTNSHRVGVEIDDQIVYVKLKNLSSCETWKEQIEQSFFSGLTMARKGLKFICRRHIIYGAFYTSIVVASLSTSSLESILSASYFSFGHEDLTAVLDNSATAHIFHDKSMFTSYHPLEPSQSQVATIGEHTSSAAGIGSVSVSWTDDDGEVHTFQLKNVLHFPKSTVNLISVTAFAKEFNPRFRESGGKDAQITTGDGHSIFVWDKTARTFEHPSSNLPELPLFPNDKKMMFAANVNHCNNICPCNNPSAYSYFGSEDIQEPTKVTNLKNGSTVSKKISWADAVRKTSTPPQLLSNAPEQIMSLSLLQEKFLRWHERCNHLSFSSMIRLAKRGILPKEFIKLEKNLPPCGSCLFGRQSRRPKKAKFGNPIRKPEHNYPGGGVSADQIISAQPGLVPQSSGNLTNKRITAVTVFVDHNSDFSYVVLMTECSGKETLRAKQEFEAFAASHGVRIAHYHADNGRFQESMFTDDVQLNAQTISFCGVNAHHQNGIVERHIRKITESSRTMLLHAERLWPEAISPILWPFAIKYAAHIHNNLSLKKERIRSNDFLARIQLKALIYRIFTHSDHLALFSIPSNILQNGILAHHFEYLLDFLHTMQEMWQWFSIHLQV